MTPLLENRRIAGPLRLSPFGPSMPDIHRWYQIIDSCSSSPSFRYTASMRRCGWLWIGVLLYCGIQSLLCTRVPWTDSQATFPGTAYAGGDRSEWSRCSSLLSLLVLEVEALFIPHRVYSIQNQRIGPFLRLRVVVLGSSLAVHFVGLPYLLPFRLA